MGSTGEYRTTHSTYREQHVAAHSRDVLGLNINDLRQFLNDADDAGVPGTTEIYVSGLTYRATRVDTKYYWAKGIGVTRHVREEQD